MGRAIDAHNALPVQGVELPDEVGRHGVLPVGVVLRTIEGLPLLYGLQGQAVVLRVRQALLLQKHRLRAPLLDGAVKVQRLGAGGVSTLPGHTGPFFSV